MLGPLARPPGGVAGGVTRTVQGQQTDAHSAGAAAAERRARCRSGAGGDAHEHVQGQQSDTLGAGAAEYIRSDTYGAGAAD